MAQVSKSVENFTLRYVERNQTNLLNMVLLMNETSETFQKKFALCVCDTIIVKCVAVQTNSRTVWTDRFRSIWLAVNGGMRRNTFKKWFVRDSTERSTTLNLTFFKWGKYFFFFTLAGINKIYNSMNLANNDKIKIHFYRTTLFFTFANFPWHVPFCEVSFHVILSRMADIWFITIFKNSYFVEIWMNFLAYGNNFGLLTGTSGGGSSTGTSPSLIGSGPAPSRLPLNSGFNSMYTSIPQTIGSITDNYRYIQNVSNRSSKQK